MFVLATVYRPPGHHTDFTKEFADFLSELVLAAYKVLIVGDINIHVDNEKDALGSAFIDILNSIGVRQHVSGPTHCRNHTLDLILSHGIDVNGVEILQQSDDISDHYLVLCKLHIVKAVNSTPSYKYGRTITSTTKDCFVSSLPDLSKFLSISNSSEQLDDVTETKDSLFSSTLDTVAPLHLRKIKEKSPTPWYNEHTRTLKRAAQKMERSWRKPKLEVFRIAWRENTLSYKKALKTARSDYFSSLLEENKHNPRYLFNTVAKLTKNQQVLTFLNSSNGFMNYYSFLEKNGICKDFQSGFRPFHSTETAFIRVTNDLLLSSDRGCISLLVLLDLSAVFDTIVLKLYLSDRHQFIAVNEEVSYQSQVQYGVPQGSVLGLLLFMLYMLPMGNIIRKHGVSFHCYADDIQLYISSWPGNTYKFEKLMKCIVDIKNWMTSHFYC